MGKVIISVVTFVFILTGSIIAAPITMSNVLTFNSTGASSSGDGEGRYNSHGRGSVNLLNGCGDYVSWTQSFIFNPVPESSTVTGKLSLKLKDDSSSWFDGPEFAVGWTNSGNWAIGEVNTGTYNYNLSIRNGSLCVTLASLGGDFYIDTATLSVSYEPAPVPEPASMLLLGLGIFSAGLMARKKIRKGD